jgi:hypothetical protein
MADGEARVQGKRALLIGINEYPNFPAERQLHGCLNDVALLRSTLRDRFGFPEAGITVLTNAQATREGILTAMKRLALETQADDVVLLYYSGHGSQMSDREGDEPDFYDETIIPSDSGRFDARTMVSHENRDISDDEIYLWLRDLGQKTSNITLWFDCCNSGSMTRAAFGGATRSVPRDERPVDQLPPSPIPRSQWAALRQTTRDVGASGWAPVGDRYVLIAACRDEQTANEYPPAGGSSGDAHGCLTYYLHQELMAAGPGTTYRDVFGPAVRRVQSIYPNQTPQLEGNRDQALFGIRDLEPAHFLEVRTRAEDSITLDGGAAHAVVPGSRYEISSSSAKQPGAPDGPLGLVEVTEVRGLTSDAQILSKTAPGAVTVGCRAFASNPGFGDAALGVSLAPAPASLEDLHRPLAEGLASSQTIRLVKPGDASPALVQVILLPRRDSAGPGDAVPQLPQITAPTWAIVGGGDRLLAPPKPAGDVKAVVDNLEQIARFQYLIAVRNPTSPLQSKVKATLLRKTPDSDWQDALPDEQGRIVFKVGDQMGFRVRHTNADPLYPNVLDFGLNFSVTLLYPPAAGAKEVLERLLPFEFGKREGQTMRLGIPEGFDGDEGHETLKFFFATTPIDFSWMRQSGVRGVPAARAPAPEDWTTIEVELIAARK